MSGLLNCLSKYGAVTINGVDMHAPWVCCYDLVAFLDDFDVRGGNTLVPHVGGTVAHPRRRTETRKALPFLISGWVKHDGTPTTNKPMTLIENTEWLRANIGIAEESDTGTVTCVWDRPDGTTRQADVHVLSSGANGAFALERPIDSVARGTLTLGFPYARWVDV